MKRRAVTVGVTLIELAAFGGALAIVWWLGRVASTDWLARVARLGLTAPAEAVVRGAARSACLYMTIGIGVLAAARIASARRQSELAIHVPWLVPAAIGASLLGFAVHLASIEVAQGAAVLPTAAGFAQGFLVGSVAAAIILVTPIDLAEAAQRARTPIAIIIAAIFGALAVAGSGPAGTGTRINLGPLQPIELVKPLAVVFLAVYFGARAPKLRWQRRRVLGLRWPRLELMVPALGVLVMIVAGLYLIGDLGPVLLLACVFLGMFFLVSRATGWVVIALALLAVMLGILATWPHLAGSGTVQTRLVMWQDPWTNGLTNGHQLGEGLWAFAAGGWTGQGLAHAATPLVPAGKTDLVLATLVEQMGAVGLVAYQLALLAIVLGALRVASASRTAERVLIAGGIAILVLAQWIVIQAGTLGQLPLTGIVVPFISSGRSSMAVFVAMTALVARLAADGRARAASTELDELHGAARGVSHVAVGFALLAALAGIAAATFHRRETSGRGILVRLGDGTLITRYNPRLVVLAGRMRRGPIVDRNGTPLATSPTAGTRTYPLGAALGTLLGPSPSTVFLPSWALERVFDARLRGYTDLGMFLPLLDMNDVARDKAFAALDENLAARTVTLTLDARLQKKTAELARDLVAKRRVPAAAIVVLDVSTGQVLARVQVPDYDPAKATWQARVHANDAPYLKRFRGAYGEWPDKTGIQGMFQSGSVGKLVTALAAVRSGRGDARLECRDEDAQGPLFTLPAWSRPIHDFTGDRPHGAPDLAAALAVSCNVYFGQLGLLLGPEPFEHLRAAGLEVGYGTRFDPGTSGSRHLASTAFGQGAMVMNVMQAARLVGALAAGGRYMRCPSTMQLDGACTATNLVDDPQALRPILDGMRRVMVDGTGGRLDEPAGVRVYGKTGTADVKGFAGEEPFGIARAQVAAPHSWFVAFAEPSSATEGAITAEHRLAIAVVVPRGGTGSSAAGPLAMQVLAAAKELGYLQ